MIKVVCGIIFHEQKILVAQNPLSHKYAGLWEFPGGKTEAMETNFEAIKREIKEELSMEVSPLFAFNPMIFNFSTGDISLQPIVCSSDSPTYFIHHHLEARWIALDQLSSIELAPTDRELAQQYRDEFWVYLQSLS